MKNIKRTSGWLAAISGLALIIRVLVEYYFGAPVVLDFADKPAKYGMDITVGMIVLAVGFLFFTCLFIILAVAAWFKKK